MSNNLLALILIVLATSVGVSGSASRVLTLTMLGVVDASLLFLYATAAPTSTFAPVLGVGAFAGAFILTIALFWLFRRK